MVIDAVVPSSGFRHFVAAASARVRPCSHAAGAVWICALYPDLVAFGLPSCELK